MGFALMEAEICESFFFVWFNKEKTKREKLRKRNTNFLFIHPLHLSSIDREIPNFLNIMKYRFLFHFFSVLVELYLRVHRRTAHMSLCNITHYNITISTDNRTHPQHTQQFMFCFLLVLPISNIIRFRSNIAGLKTETMASNAAAVCMRRYTMGMWMCMENFSHLIFNSVHGYNRNS